jgi:hypothetical protein
VEAWALAALAALVAGILDFTEVPALAPAPALAVVLFPLLETFTPTFPTLIFLAIAISSRYPSGFLQDCKP